MPCQHSFFIHGRSLVNQAPLDRVKAFSTECSSFSLLEITFSYLQSSNFNTSRTSWNVSSSMSFLWFLPPDMLFFFNQLISFINSWNITFMYLCFPLLNLRIRNRIHLVFETPAASKFILWIYYVTCKCLVEAWTQP